MRTAPRNQSSSREAMCWLVNRSHFMMLSHREALSAHTNKVLPYLSCSYTLNHYLVLQQAMGIDPNLGGITSAKYQLWEAGRCCTEE